MAELHQVVVRSVGTATPALPAALARALPVAPERLARCVYQAPAVLLAGLAQPEASKIAEILTQSGLEVEVTAQGEALNEGGPDLELAVHVGEPSNFREVAARVARFVGCDSARAVRLLCSAPPVVLGQVSAATAAALSKYLEPLGAEVDISQIADSRYDVFVDAKELTLRDRICRQLTEQGVTPEPEGPLVALGVPRQAALQLWTRVGADPKWRMVDQAFQRFDILLEAAPDTQAATDALVAVTGMPAELVPKVRARLPLLLREAVPSAQIGAILQTLARGGVSAAAKLITFTNWDIVVTSSKDPIAAAEIAAQILGREQPELNLALRRLPARLDVASGLTRARWVVHELAQVGTEAVLEAR